MTPEQAAARAIVEALPDETRRELWRIVAELVEVGASVLLAEQTRTERLAAARRSWLAAGAELRAAVAAVCPGRHMPRQHRDRRPPWCELCGLDDVGQVQRPLVTP